MEEEQIIQMLDAKGDGSLWEDPDFPPSDASLYKNPNRLPEYAEDEPRATYGPHPWVRPHEWAREDGQTNDPDYFKDETESGDVIQGTLGDCWLLSAMASVATHPHQLIENLFGSELDDFKRYGVFTCRFYKDGDWREVTTDTRIPYGGGEAGGPYAKPVYGRCRDTNEVWVPFLQKAYAKLHRNYEALDGGSIAEALVDLTGGSSEKMLLTDPKIQAMVENGTLWNKLKKYMEWGYLVCCSNSVQGGGFEEEGAQGILINHAYSVLYIKEVGPLKFIKVRNPWGRGEWKGDWSDNDSKWQDHPEVEAAMQNDQDAMFKIDDEDGTFWMVWEDFVVQFNKVYICRIFDDDQFQQYAVSGEWMGKSAAGAHKLILDADGDDDPNAALTKRDSQGRVKMDGDAFWFNNPQYRLTVTEKTNVYISLMQRDRRMAGVRDNASINFVVLRQRKNATGRAWVQEPSDVVADASRANFSYNFPQREVSKGNIELSPKYKYIVVPHTANRGRELDFHLRVFSPKQLLLQPLPPCSMVALAGSWEKSSARDTAGGPLKKKTDSGFRDNSKWCQNPQFWLSLPPGTTDRVTVKLVLRRTDPPKLDEKGKPLARKDDGDFMGMVVTRVTPEDDGTTRRRRQEAKTNPLGETLPSKESSLRSASSRPHAVQNQETVPEMPARQLVVSADEWSQSSDYGDKEVATTLLENLNPEWMQHGLLIVPTLSKDGRGGNFTLEAHSDVPVLMEELPESRSMTVAGEWVEGNAVGSHLYPDWKRNPKYQLRLLSDRPAKIKITVTRPDAVWKAQCRKDTVGCMMGFYLMAGAKPNREEGGAIMYEGKPWTESSFVPMNTVSTPKDFYLEPLPDEEVYTIMPAIFEPQHRGPFMLSVTTDVEFQLKRDRGGKS